MKRILSFCLILVLCFAAVGCAGEENLSSQGIASTGLVSDQIYGVLPTDETYAPEAPYVPVDPNQLELIPYLYPKDAPKPENKESGEYNYIANTNTGKFHYPDCKSVDLMNEENKYPFNGTRDELMGEGFVPCENCNP